jgi:beta-lactam-binding protein with PASTA domain
MRSLICLGCMLSAMSMAVAGEIYGTITDAGKPVPEGTKIEVTVAGKSFTGATDKLGTYHVQATEKGKGTLTAYYRDQKPTADIFSFEKATRYDYTVETVDGKLTLKRK